MTTTQPASNSFAKRLAHTDKKIRDKAVKALGKWLSSRQDLDQLELLKLWKGLFYCFWMSDKPLIQQQLSNTLATIILSLPSTVAIPFVKAFWEIIVREWIGIDRYRLDKYYLLLRRYVHYTLVFLMNNNWDTDLVEQYVEMMKSGVFSPSNPQVPNSIRTHIADIFLEELEKVVPVERTEEIPIDKILEPFFYFISRNSNALVYNRLQENLLLPLLERMNDDSEEENVQRRYNFSSISRLLTQIVTDAETTGVKRRRINEFLSGMSGTGIESEAQDSDSMDTEELESEEAEPLQISKADSKKRKRQKPSQALDEVDQVAVNEIVSEPIQVKDAKKKKKQKVVEKPVKEITEAINEPVQVKENKKKKKQKAAENPVESELVEEIAEEVTEPVKVKVSKKQKKHKVVEEVVQQSIMEEEIVASQEPVKKVSKKLKKHKVVEPEPTVVEVTVKKSKKVKTEKTVREDEGVSTPKLVEPSTPLSSASKKSVQWGLENNSVKRFKKQLPVSPKPSPVASDRKPVKSALKKSKRSFTVTTTTTSSI